MIRFAIYVVSASILLSSGFLLFFVFIRRDYLKNGRLTPLSTTLESILFFLLGASAYIFVPEDWPAVHTPVINVSIGWLLIVGGLGITIVAISQLGLSRSFGINANMLKQTSFYRLTRNPQVLGFVIAVIGFVILWPSWYAVGWAAQFLILAHVAVVTEEEHLRNRYGNEYSAYCKRVPRYIWLRRR